jgi:hypothetical protein
VVRAVVTMPDKEPPRLGASPSSASARASSPSERHYRSSVPVGTIEDTGFTSGSNTGISVTSFDIPRTL